MRDVADEANGARVLVVEDDAALARMLARKLAPHATVLVASSLHEARACIADLCVAEPRAAERGERQAGGIAGAIVDVGLPDGSGLDLVAELRRSEPPVPTLVFTANADAETINRAQRLGAELACKPASIANILSFLGRALSSRQGAAPSGQALALACAAEHALTSRETEVLGAALGDLDRAESADALGLSESTMKTHIASILRKTGQPTLRALVQQLRRTLCAAVLLAAAGAAAPGCDLRLDTQVGCSRWGNSPLPGTDCGGECVQLASDVRHCGACFNACTPARTGDTVWCAGQCYSSPTLANVDGQTLEALAVDGSDVFLATGCDGSILRVPKDPSGDGSVPEPTVMASGQLGAHALALDATHLYWSIQCRPPACCSEDGAVLRVPLGGGAPEVVLPLLASSVTEITLDATTVWLTTSADGIWSVPKAGGQPTQLVTEGSFGAIAVDDTTVYAAGYLPSASSQGAFDLYAIPKAGGDPVGLTDGKTIHGLALDSWNVYCLAVWPQDNQGVLLSVPKSGGVAVVLGPAQGSESLDRQRPGMLLHDHALYYYYYHQQIRRLSVAGGPFAVVVNGLYDLPPPEPLAIDDTSIYYVSAGKLSRLPL
jgi:DNA-binding NarL/FixJ family response regulator